MPTNLPQKPEPELEPAEDLSQSIGGWMIALLWLLVLGGGTLLAHQWLQQRHEARAPVWQETINGKAALTLQADGFGQYVLPGKANGQRIDFLLDTGASEISIPGALAQELGLKRGRGYPVITANGTVTVFSTRLQSISIGPFSLTDVRAHINPAMDGELALLGMSFLRHFELLQRAGELTISVP